MTDPSRTDDPAQFRALFRSLVLDPALLLDRVLAAEALARVRRRGRPARPPTGSSRPLVTLAVFLGQVLSDDHSCRAAVARLLAWRAARGLPPCSPDTGGYCKARQRLPEALLPRLVRDTADRLQEHAPEAWLFHGRRVVLADGSTVSACPTPPRTRPPTPSTAARSRGCGFPIARIVVLLSLATGCVLDAAIGGRRGQADRRARRCCARCTAGCGAGDILLADGYYSSFDEVVTLAGRWASTW